MMAYVKEREFADKFDSRFQRLALDVVYENRLLDLSVRLATAYEDMRQAKDAIIESKQVTIGHRVRRSSAKRYWGQDWTLRYPSEFNKFMNGIFPDILLYALEDGEGGFEDVIVIDNKSVFRQLKDDEHLLQKVLASEHNGMVCPRFSWFSTPVVLKPVATLN
jgi:hypothetical protein